MHSLNIITKYTFGDRVCFDSPTQLRNGNGKIVGIMIDEFMVITYMIAIEPGDYDDVQAGILESEIIDLSNN